MAWLDRSDTECQPCDRFTSGDDGYYGPTPHECFAPFNEPGARLCGEDGGRVYFCANCRRDHHADGYNSCRGRREPCPFGHPACAAALLAPDAGEGK